MINLQSPNYNEISPNLNLLDYTIRSDKCIIISGFGLIGNVESFSL